MKLPDEIIYYIIKILQNENELRAIMNFCKYLKWEWRPFTDTQAIKIIENERNITSKQKVYDYKLNYKQNMQNLWEKTGIDDGLSNDYLIKKLNNKTRMYRTVWSLSQIKDIQNKRYFVDNENYTNLNLVDLTYFVFIDKRLKPQNIEYTFQNFSGHKKPAKYYIKKQLKNYIN